MDLVTYLSKYIPPFIETGGEMYIFQIFINHAHYDIRFCYDAKRYSKSGSPSFLYLVENISSQKELLNDLKWLRKQLKKDGYLTGDYGKPGGYTKKSYHEHIGGS
jgi:hypothetical protein